MMSWALVLLTGCGSELSFVSAVAERTLEVGPTLLGKR